MVRREGRVGGSGAAFAALVVCAAAAAAAVAADYTLNLVRDLWHANKVQLLSSSK